MIHTLSCQRPAWRLGALFALLLAGLMFIPSILEANSPPATPSSVTVTRADGTLTVSGYSVGSATKYHITYTSNGGKSWNAAASPNDNYSANTITIGGADNNKTYTVGVRAGNAHGWSGWRNSQPAKPFRLPPPAAPSSVTVTRSHDALTASWNAVTGATSYHITYTSNKGASWSLAALNHASSSITISGVDNSKTYIVAVRARSAHGDSGWRNSPAAGPYLPPAIPRGLKATSGNQRVTLSWDNPSDSTITGYEYQYRAAGSWSAWTDIAGSTRVTTSFNKSGLTNGTEYRFKLRAVNGHGASLPAPRYWPWYVAATPNDGANIPKPPGTSPPATPASVTATLDDDTLQASWPADELAVSYHVTYSSDGEASWSLAALNHPSNAITISPVASNGNYIVAVRAGNDSGWSGWRNSAPVGPGSRDSSKDKTLDSNNGHAGYIWSNGTTMWVTDEGDDKVYAYKMSDGSRDSAKDIYFGANFNAITAMTSDGTTMWIGDLSNWTKLWAYDISSRQRDSGKDITLDSSTYMGSDGFWTDGTTMYVGDNYDDKIYAYTIATGQRDTSKEITPVTENTNLSGLWSNGTTMWVTDAVADKVYAYKMSDGSRDSARDYNSLAGGSNVTPLGLWSDGTTMWIVDGYDNVIYAYHAIK